MYFIQYPSQVVILISTTFVVVTYGQESSTTESYSGSSQRNLADLRRSGRFQCQEQPEDIQRVQRKSEIHCRCPTIYAPVCGSDGVTYHNRCFLNCTATHKYHRFSHVTVTIESWGPCPEDELSRS